MLPIARIWRISPSWLTANLPLMPTCGLAETQLQCTITTNRRMLTYRTSLIWLTMFQITCSTQTRLYWHNQQWFKILTTSSKPKPFWMWVGLRTLGIQLPFGLTQLHLWVRLSSRTQKILRHYSVCRQQLSWFSKLFPPMTSWASSLILAVSLQVLPGYMAW